MYVCVGGVGLVDDRWQYFVFKDYLFLQGLQWLLSLQKLCMISDPHQAKSQPLNPLFQMK